MKPPRFISQHVFLCKLHRGKIERNTPNPIWASYSWNYNFFFLPLGFSPMYVHSTQEQTMLCFVCARDKWIIGRKHISNHIGSSSSSRKKSKLARSLEILLGQEWKPISHFHSILSFLSSQSYEEEEDDDDEVKVEWILSRFIGFCFFLGRWKCVFK